MSADVTFTLEPNFMFTLTCISTGEPATTVTWTRDSVTVTETQRSRLEDRVIPQYSHTLTIQYKHRGRVEGLYHCSVSNAVPSESSTELYVHGIEIATQPPHRYSFIITCTVLYSSLSSL